jgi:uncharacterized membrane protein
MSEAEVAKAAASKAPGRAVRIALAVSVALNLAVVGVVAGAALKHGGGHEMERDIGFGPFSEALSREDRRALRGQILQRAPELRSVRKEMQADTQSLLAVLRAEPFDAAGLTAVMETQRVRMAGRLELGQTVLRDFLIAMTPEARKDFADRLEARLKGGDKP